MSTPDTETFRFGDYRAILNFEAYYDLIFYAPYEWCQFLLDYNNWRYLDEAGRSFHSDHVEMLADLATIEAEKLPEEIRHPIDGTARNMPTLIRYLAAALSWKVANTKLEEANNDYAEGEPTFAVKQAVRAAARWRRSGAQRKWRAWESSAEFGSEWMAVSGSSGIHR
jgi:hypothetical protein